MSIYLKWRDTAVRSKDRFMSNLFSYLSPRWYPVNIIGSTVYDIFGMYGDQLSSGSVAVDQVYSDLFLNDVQSTLATGRSVSKMYDNFGVLLGVDKLYAQDYNYYDTTKSLQSYRQELKLLTEAFLSGNTEEGLRRVGHAYSGIAPIIIQPSMFYNGWNLTTYEGTVKAVGDSFVVIDTYIPGIGYIIPSSGSFSVGDTYAVSWSDLGVNTYIYDETHFYDGIEAYFFITTGSFGSLIRNSVNSSVQKVIGANTICDTFFSPDFNYYRPQTGTGSVTINDHLALSENGYLYNSAPTPIIGTVFTGSVIASPVDFNSYYDSSYFYDINGLYDGLPAASASVYYDIYYDWLVLTRNDSYYKFAVRTYPTANIPSTVYYKEYNPEGIDLLTFTSGSLGGHWVFNQKETLWDISGNGNNLIRKVSGGTPAYTLSREETRTGLLTSTSMHYTGSVGSSMNFSNSFYFEMWAKGIDSSVTSGSIILKRQSSEDYSAALTANGYLFGLDVASQKLSLSVRNTTTTTATASIAGYLSEAPSRYHYFAGSYVSGSMFLYIDGQQVGYLTGSVTPANLSSNTFTTFFASATDVGIDEVVATNGYLTSDLALQHFNDTKPRLRRLATNIGGDAYHQPQITIYAVGPEEVEFHQFSVCAIGITTPYAFSLKDPDILRIPIFKTI